MSAKGACAAHSRAQEWQLQCGHIGPHHPGDAPSQRTNKTLKSRARISTDGPQPFTPALPSLGTKASIPGTWDFSFLLFFFF